MLLFDDAGTWFAARPGPRSATESRAAAALDHLLQRLDAFEGVAIITTHGDDALAPALVRRLSMRVRFGLPDEELRIQLWAAHLTPELPTAGALDLARLARRFPLSGAGIRNCAVRAAYLAAQDGCAMTQSHLERALAFEVGELGALGAAGDPQD
jgi:SpoVK/Ycf46/Vps4 family AAA+-type ATPase